jgi:hypothetical protein
MFETGNSCKPALSSSAPLCVRHQRQVDDEHTTPSRKVASAQRPIVRLHGPSAEGKAQPEAGAVRGFLGQAPAFILDLEELTPISGVSASPLGRGIRRMTESCLRKRGTPFSTSASVGAGLRRAETILRARAMSSVRCSSMKS